MAGWGDDPELDRLRQLIEEGWSVVDLKEEPGAGGPSDTVVLEKEGQRQQCTSDHLAFHRYVEYLREEQR